MLDWLIISCTYAVLSGVFQCHVLPGDADSWALVRLQGGLPNQGVHCQYALYLVQININTLKLSWLHTSHEKTQDNQIDITC